MINRRGIVGMFASLLTNMWAWIVIIILLGAYFFGGSLLALVQNPAEEWTIFPLEDSERGLAMYLPKSSETDVYMVGFPEEIISACLTRMSWSPFGDGSGPVNTMTNAVGFAVWIDGERLGGGNACFGEMHSTSEGIMQKGYSGCESGASGCPCPGWCYKWQVVKSVDASIDLTEYFEERIAGKTTHFKIKTEPVFCTGGVSKGRASGIEIGKQTLRIEYIPSGVKERVEILERDCISEGCPDDYVCNQETGVCERTIVEETIQKVYTNVYQDCRNVGCPSDFSCEALECTEDMELSGYDCTDETYVCKSEVMTTISSTESFIDQILDWIENLLGGIFR